MKRIKNREDSLIFGLSFFMIACSVLGTVFCNAMNETMKSELYAMETEIVTLAAISGADMKELFLQIFLKRIRSLLLVLFISGVHFAPLIHMILTGVIGFCEAVKICSLTMNSGIWGLLKYICFWFPQGLIYIPVLYLIFWWMPVYERRWTWVSVSLLLLGIAAGAAVESMVNPWVLTLC